MPRSKEIQKQMRKKVIEIYQSGKGYKAISKALGLPQTTVRAIIYKWRKHGTVENFPRSGRPTKITPRVQRQLNKEVTKDPTTTSKELQASLASVKVPYIGLSLSRDINIFKGHPPIQLSLKFSWTGEETSQRPAPGSLSHFTMYYVSYMWDSTFRAGDKDALRTARAKLPRAIRESTATSTAVTLGACGKASSPSPTTGQLHLPVTVMPPFQMR
ncbi:hypothetical protein QTP86_010315 [Hemibagrus guttatus]|nr:hypothetical protein QTP86_010315 [Hemibagrus guttatus]